MQTVNIHVCDPCLNPAKGGLGRCVCGARTPIAYRARASHPTMVREIRKELDLSYALDLISGGARERILRILDKQEIAE